MIDKTGISKQMSYWLRHDPEGLEMDDQGYVQMDELIEKLKDRFPEINRETVEEVAKEGKKRYEITEDKVRAAYGHTLDIDLGLEEDENVEELYFGATRESIHKILRQGIEPDGRTKVHLSATKKIAEDIAKRGTDDPVILKIDIEEARNDGKSFYKATEEVYLTDRVEAKYIEKV